MSELGMPKDRLEAFSDCVIAFAMTLLVIDIRFPELGANIDNHGMLLALLALLPNFAVYLVSFLVCTVWWVSHHTFIHDLRHVDRPLLWINNLFLMWIAMMPLPTALLGHHLGQPVATTFYGAVCAFTGLSFWLMRWHASGRGQLMKRQIGEAELRRRQRISLGCPILYLIVTAASFFFPLFALCLYAAIACYFAVANFGSAQSRATVLSE